MEMGDIGKHPDHDFLPRFLLPLSLPPCFPLSLWPSFFVFYLLALCYYFLSFIFFFKSIWLTCLFLPSLGKSKATGDKIFSGQLDLTIRSDFVAIPTQWCSHRLFMEESALTVWHQCISQKPESQLKAAPNKLGLDSRKLQFFFDIFGIFKHAWVWLLTF